MITELETVVEGSIDTEELIEGLGSNLAGALVPLLADDLSVNTDKAVEEYDTAEELTVEETVDVLEGLVLDDSRLMDTVEVTVDLRLEEGEGKLEVLERVFIVVTELELDVTVSELTVLKVTALEVTELELTLPRALELRTAELEKLELAVWDLEVLVMAGVELDTINPSETGRELTMLELAELLELERISVEVCVVADTSGQELGTLVLDRLEGVDE